MPCSREKIARPLCIPEPKFDGPERDILGQLVVTTDVGGSKICNMKDKLLDISHTYGCNDDIEFNPSKSSIMFIDTRKAGNAQSMTIGGKILNAVTSFSFLGHIICNDLSDDADLNAKSRQMYANSNILVRNPCVHGLN